MKIQISGRTGHSRATSRRREDGMAVMVVFILVVIVLIYLAGNIRTLHNLNRDLKIIERQQTRRLLAAGNSTNSAPVTNLAPAKPIRN